MKKQLLTFLLPVLVSIPLHGQEGKKWRHTWTEVVAEAGTARLYSDMNKNRWGWVAGAGLRFKVHHYWTMMLSVNYASLSGYDRQKDYSYRTWLAAPDMRAEYHFYNLHERTLGYNKRELLLYEPQTTWMVIFGIGGTYFKPVPGDALVEVYDDDYQRFRHSFLIALGYKHSLTKRWSVGLESGFRFTATDHLDAYVPGEKKGADELVYGRISLSYLLNLKKIAGAVD